MGDAQATAPAPGRQEGERSRVGLLPWWVIGRASPGATRRPLTAQAVPATMGAAPCGKGAVQRETRPQWPGLVREGEGRSVCDAPWDLGVVQVYVASVPSDSCRWLPLLAPRMEGGSDVPPGGRRGPVSAPFGP